MNEYIKTTPQGTKLYYKDKEKTILHREDGPAVIGAKGLDVKWYRNNMLHRMDGPAIEYADGRRMWFVNEEFIFEVNSSGDIYKKPQ
jgi:hypothetical protein